MSQGNDRQDSEVIEDYVAAIKDSEFLTIVIEGDDDKDVYQEFEEIYEHNNPIVSVLEVGGRNTALGIFKRLKDTEYIHKVIFIVDKDQWVITGIEEEYQHERVIFTHGYSFENDVFIDGCLVKDMEAKNPETFNQELPVMLKWYALEMDRILNNRQTFNLSVDINHLFNQTDSFINPQEGESFPQETFNRLLTEYPHLLRGKTLLKFYTRIMNKRSDKKYKNQYSEIQTIENVCKNKGNCLNKIFNDVDKLIS